MKKNVKKLLSMLTAAMLLVSLLPMAAFAVDEPVLTAPDDVLNLDEPALPLPADNAAPEEAVQENGELISCAMIFMDYPTAGRTLGEVLATIRPRIGDPFSVVPNFSYEIAQDDLFMMNDNDRFEAGKQYGIELILTAEPGYRFDIFETKCYIDGQDIPSDIINITHTGDNIIVWANFDVAKAAEPVYTGWILDDYGWRYYGDNGKPVTDSWALDSQGWCYLGSDGYLKTNAWQLDSVGWCYLDDSGHVVTNSWKADSHGWVYLDGEGRMTRNAWVLDSQGWCYVGDDGYMVTNTWKMDSQGWCYLDDSGHIVTNSWKQDSHGWVYLDENGRMVYNCWQQDSSGWVWIGADGYAT